jgi:integrase
MPAGPKVTFGEACSEWLRYVEFDRQRSPSTLRDYRNSVNRYLLPELGAETPLARIDTARIDAMRERLLAEGVLSRRTIQKLLVMLHGILQRAKRKGWVAANAAADAERVTLKRSGDFTVLAPVEIEAVVRAAANEREAAILTTAAFTGLRMGEVRALRWQDVDFAKRLVHVRRGYVQGVFDVPKSRKVRSVPMVDQVAVALDALSRRERFTRPDDLVFGNELGRPFHDGQVRQSFYAALNRAGLGRLREKDPPIVFHDLRHTFGTLAVQVFPLSDVKAMMGHESIETTMIYVHHVPQHDAAPKHHHQPRSGDCISESATLCRGRVVAG